LIPRPSYIHHALCIHYLQNGQKKKALFNRKGKKSTIHFLKKGDQEGDEALQSKTLASTRRNEKQKKQIN